MSCGDVFSLLLTASLFGCVQHSDLGGQKQVDCAPQCLDAGSTPMVPGPMRPDARVMSESPEELAELVRRMSGLWWGQAELGPRFVDGVQQIREFEVTFRSEKGGSQGTFVVRCLKEPECDPFGFGSANSAGGSFRILNLKPESGGVGELSWVAPGRPELIASVSDVQRSEFRGGPALTFDVGFLNGGPEASLFAKVSLALGAWPGESDAPSDGRTADGGTP